MSLPPALFGAFDRHNFGDLLFPHLLTALLPDHDFSVLGLAPHDLRPFGGHRVAPLQTGQVQDLIHTGGEVLTCTAWQAAVMLLDPEEAASAVAQYGEDTDAGARWAQQQLGTMRQIPYVVDRYALAPGGHLIFHAVGGVEWETLSAPQRHEVTAALRQAHWLSVRDHVTQSFLRAAGIEAPLCPDPAVMVEQCFGEVIRLHGEQGAPKDLAEAFPQGYLACQFSADFADDVTLDALARELAKVVAATGWGIVLFCAGTAPWHDDGRLYQKLMQHLPRRLARMFPSLHLWDVCALIAGSRCAVASSLHVRIVALAYGLPRVSLARPQSSEGSDKCAAFAETWEPHGSVCRVPVGEVESAVRRAIAVDPEDLRTQAEALKAIYLASLGQWSGLLARQPGPTPRLTQ